MNSLSFSGVRWIVLAVCTGAVICFSSLNASAQRIEIPRRHEKPPGPPLSPKEAVAKMTVPEGFTVEIVAAEPDIVNPVAMAIDERGRFWITESLEYPRREPGPGRDRVKVLEDTTGDGKADKVTVFLEGLNIPSGIAVGHGGVWIANSPDILFVPDADRDAVPDGPPQVVVTGFGRHDTHELPNSLTWGPDGWLYGLNGVFNPATVRYPKSNPNFKEDHPGFQFDAAMFRIHPHTREFDIFARGTSNPWGIAFNEDGEAFISACVIDHLWHITETGYYRRQAGAYPPFTWPIESIVEHKHQQAAYCGIHYFDSDAYPEKYRRKLYMGNIHGGCINVDRIEKNGSTYKGFGEPDFLTANDAWFMPVAQKTGPDGCLYILDWYDRYHCYQDANADPKGIERAKGRLYRVRYNDTPRKWNFDLGQSSDDELIELLGAPKDYARSTAQRLLLERSTSETVTKLLTTVDDSKVSRIKQRHAFFALVGTAVLNHQHEDMVSPRLLGWFMNNPDHIIRAQAARAILRMPKFRANLIENLPKSRWGDSDFGKLPPELQLQGLIAISTLPDSPYLLEGFLKLLASGQNDPLIPRIVWQNLQPRLENHATEFVELLHKQQYLKAINMTQMMPRIVERVLARRSPDLTPIASLFKFLANGSSDTGDLAAQCLDVLAERVQTRQIVGQQLEQLKSLMAEPVREILQSGNNSKLYQSALLLAVSWKDESGLKSARGVLASNDSPDKLRIASLKALVSIRDEPTLEIVEQLLSSRKGLSAEFHASVIGSLGDFDDDRVAGLVLRSYGKLEATAQPKAIELLTQRGSWAKDLLAAIGRKELPATALNQNQVRRLLEGNDEELKQLVTKHWGTIRTTRDPKRVELIAEMKQLLSKKPGDAKAGEAVFKKVCAQCHKMYGEGADVGPDITSNGRGNFDQLLSNVFDPSLVIGAAYQARTVVTTSGRVLTGLPVEENDQRVVLKVQGGKQEIIPRNEIEILKISELSMMPEQLETQLKPQELADLFSFITLDKHPSDPNAKRISGFGSLTGAAAGEKK